MGDTANSAEHHAQAEQILSFIIFALAACGLYASRLYTYILFHTLVEIFCIFVMLSVFSLTWHSRRLLDNHYFLFLAISFLSLSALELVHTFAYKGFGVFRMHDSNLPTQFWIAFRYMFSLAFLAAPVFITRRLNTTATVIAFAVVTALLISAIFSGNFPDCFIEGRGLTPFKVFSEYLIIVILLAAMGVLYSRRTHFDPHVLRMLLAALVSAAVAETAFTQYISVYGPANLAGHLFLFFSAFLIYRAIVVTAIKEPAALLFRKLELSREALKNTEERLRFALEACHIGAWEFDLKDRIIYRSLEHDRIFGYAEPPPRWTLETFLQHALPEYHTEIEAMVRAATSAPGDVTYECRIRRADGEIRWIWFSGHRLTDISGNNRMAGIVQDITERKLTEEKIRAAAMELQATNCELDNQMKERTRELREKEVLLKEIHHRVKNNLQVISSLVSLQADSSGDETTRGGLRDVMYRVRSMSLVHEKLYQSADLARIDFAEYTRSLLNYLWRAHGSVAAAIVLTLDLEPLSLPVDIAVPCGLILNELAGNALKHAFRGRTDGKVTVTLNRAGDGTVRLCVSDNGNGLPPGLEWKQSSSLGLRLVQMLAGQLHAIAELHRGDGTEFQITFKLPEAANDREQRHG